MEGGLGASLELDVKAGVETAFSLDMVHLIVHACSALLYRERKKVPIYSQTFIVKVVNFFEANSRHAIYPHQLKTVT